jgi:uncharacterized membrane protein YfcA
MINLEHNIIAGLFVGFLVGLTGMGGSSLMAPILIFLFHFKAKFAIGSDLAYGAIMKIFGSWQHYKRGTVDMKLVRNLAIGSVPASLLGVWCLHSLDKRNGDASNGLIIELLGGALVLVSIVLMVRSIPAVEKWFTAKAGYQPRNNVAWAITIGAAVGFLVGLTSIGAGTLFGVALILVFGLTPRQTVGTDIFHGCLLAGVAAVGHVFAGDVDYALVGSLLLGAIPGVLFGGAVSTRMPDNVLRPALGGILLLIGCKMVWPLLAIV